MPSGFTGFTEFLYLTAAGGEYKRWLARIQSFCRTMSSFENPKNPKESQRIFARGAPGRRESKDSFEILGRRLSRPSSRSTRPAPAMQRIPENPRASHDDRDSRPIPEPDAPFVHTGRTSRAKNPKESQRIAPDSRCFRRCFEDALEILGRFQSQTPRLFTQAAPAEQRIPKNPRESHQTRDASGDTSQMLWRCSGGSRAHTHTGRVAKGISKNPTPGRVADDAGNPRASPSIPPKRRPRNTHTHKRNGSFFLFVPNKIEIHFNVERARRHTGAGPPTAPSGRRSPERRQS